VVGSRHSRGDSRGRDKASFFVRELGRSKENEEGTDEVFVDALDLAAKWSGGHRCGWQLQCGAARTAQGSGVRGRYVVLGLCGRGISKHN
jgi:hypothetical protein